MTASQYSQLSRTVCFGDLKQAALYFDQVIPINPQEFIDYAGDPLVSDKSGEENGRRFVKTDDELLFAWMFRLRDGLTKHEALLHELVTPKETGIGISELALKLADATYALQINIRETHERIFLSPGYSMLGHDGIPARHDFQQELTFQTYLHNPVMKSHPSVNCAGPLKSFMRDIADSGWSVLSPRFIPKFSPTSTVERSSYELALSGISLVDSASLSWEEIVDIRRDPGSRARLRRFRLFFQQNFQGKDPDFVKDALLQSMDDYDQECKSRGLTRRDGFFSKIFTSIESYISAAGIAASALFGTEQAGTMASVAALPLLKPVGSAMLELKKSNRDLKDFKDRHSLAYLIQMRDASAI